jgi:hypothetical protein
VMITGIQRENMPVLKNNYAAQVLSAFECVDARLTTQENTTSLVI